MHKEYLARNNLQCFICHISNIYMCVCVCVCVRVCVCKENFAITYNG